MAERTLAQNVAQAIAEFKGIKDIEGESVEGVKNMEFYPDEEQLQSLVLSIFYEEK